MKRVLSLLLSVLMLLSITAGMDFSAYADEPCEHANYHLVNQVAATIDAPGYSGDKVCDDCGETFETGQETYLKGWVLVDDIWYFIDEESHEKLTGMQVIKNKTYYFNDNGEMQTGFIEIDDVTYYFDETGAMTVGWKKINNFWYHFDNSGAMQIYWQYIGSDWYFFNINGVMQTGWLLQNTNSWYYLNSNGTMAKGWLKLNGSWFYLNNSGRMLTDWQKIGGNWYYFNNNGKMQTGWHQSGNNWLYLKSDGAMAKGWQLVGKTWYYFNNSGIMQRGWLKYKSCWYYLKSSGAMATDWEKINGEWYFFGSDGVMQTGYVNVYATYTSSYVNNANRTNNLKVASKAISGTIIKPGETFNFNTVVGPRTAARGYKTATVFTGPEGTAQELGGGICQVASTMFNTCLLANVTINERHQHSQRVSYVPLGRDAAISGSSKNFKWTNNTGYTIKVEMVCEGGKISCTFYTVEHVSPPNVSLNVTRSGNTFTLKRSVNGSVNYTTKSTY